MQGLIAMITIMLWPITKLCRICLIIKCILWDNGHVWVKAKHVQSRKNVISLFNLYECEECGQCMATEK